MFDKVVVQKVVTPKESDNKITKGPINDFELDMLKSQIELCINQRRDLIDLVQ